MVLRAYFDESGLDAHKHKALIIGGFLASAEEWEKASDAWVACLKESPAIEYSSSRNNTCGKSNRLARVIAQFDLQGFCASIPHAYFAGRDPKASRKIMGTRIYDWGFLTATSGVLQYVERVYPCETVDFVFDQRNELSACIATYNEMKICEWPPLMARAGECIGGDDKELMPLQMADLLSGEFFAMTNGQKPSEAWKIIASAHPVAHLLGYLPITSQKILASQKLGKEVQDSAGCILKRIYKDKERSMELVNDVAELVLRKEFFDIQFRRLEELYEGDEVYKDFIASGGKFSAIKNSVTRSSKE